MGRRAVKDQRRHLWCLFYLRPWTVNLIGTSIFLNNVRALSRLVGHAFCSPARYSTNADPFTTSIFFVTIEHASTCKCRTSAQASIVQSTCTWHCHKKAVSEYRLRCSSSLHPTVNFRNEKYYLTYATLQISFPQAP